MKKRKVMALALSCLMVLSVAACGKDGNPANSNQVPGSTGTEAQALQARKYPRRKRRAQRLRISPCGLIPSATGEIRPRWTA